MRQWRHWAILAAALLIVCSCAKGDRSQQGYGQVRSAITVAAARVLGFEDPTNDWQSTSGTVSASDQSAEGSYSLALTGVGYAEVQSVPLSSLGEVADTVSYDLLLPTEQPNPWWYGETQLFVDLPSQGVYNAFLGQQNLTGLPLDTFNRITFSLPPNVVAALEADYGDLRFRIVLNVPQGSGTYLLDRLWLEAGGVPPPDGGAGGAAGAAGQETLSVWLPAGVGLTEALLAAANGAQIADGTRLVGAAGSVTVTNAGSNEVNLGVDSQSEDIWSVGPVVLRDRAVVDGLVRSAATVTLGADAHATEGTEEGAVLTPLTHLARQIDFPLGGTDLYRPPDSPPYALAPGKHGNVDIHSRSALELSAGTYYLESLSIQPEAVLTVNTSEGPVLVYVRSTFNFVGEYQLIGQPSDVFIAVFDSGTVSLERALSATLVVSVGTLRFAPTRPGDFAGSFFAQQAIVAEPNLTIRHVPFAHWEQVLPVNPFVQCVGVFDATHAFAVFGYESQLGAEIVIPAGANNRLEPGANEVRLPETFEPGTHERVVLAGFDGTSISWILGGVTATADPSSPRCQLDDLPADEPPSVILEGSNRPDPAAQQTLVGNRFGPGLRQEPGPWPWGSSLQVIDQTTSGSAPDGTGTIQQALAPANGSEPFRIIINTVFSGSDACSGAEPYLFGMIGEGGDFQWQPLPEMPENASQTVYAVFEADVPPTQESVDLWIVLWDADTPPCGDDDDPEMYLHLTVNTRTGVYGGGAWSDDPDWSVIVGPDDTCYQAPDGWGFCWEVVPPVHPKPKTCLSWNASYIDANTGEDFANQPGLQVLPASFARARLELYNHTDYTLIWDGVLDEQGCIPESEAPELQRWYLGPTNKLTARFEVTTELCYDPEGADCCADPNRAGCEVGGVNVEGARFVVNSGQGAPETLCTVWTTEESYSDPSCLVRMPSEGAFPLWIEGFPPSRIIVRSDKHSAPVRIAAALSQLLQREEEAEGDLGVRYALIDLAGAPSEGLITYNADTTCALTQQVNGESVVVERDSCIDAGIGVISIRPDMHCEAATLPECFTDLQEGTYTACDVEAGAPCLPGDSWSKYVIAHETGHAIQGRAWGSLDLFYTFGGNSDLPGAPDLCSCRHVAFNNTYHCLQSLERPNAAQVEGWAQFLASKVWNRAGEADCVFNYYKEFNDSSEGLLQPPVPRSCREPVRWRNTHCLGVEDSPGYAFADMGTEYDWMTFLWNVNTVSDNRSVLPHLINVYFTACGGRCQGILRVVSWERVGTGARRHSLREGAEEYYASVDELQKRNHFIAMGDEHGVSRDTTPLPP